MPFVLDTFKSGLKLRMQDLEDNESIADDIAEQERILSSTFGSQIEILEYKGSALDMETVENLAKEATAGVGSFDEKTDDEDEETDVEEDVIEGEPTPVQFFNSGIQFSCEPVTTPMILVAG